MCLFRPSDGDCQSQDGTCAFHEVCWIDRIESQDAIPINILRPRDNGRHFPDYIFKCIFLNNNIRILIEVSLKFVPNVSINNNPALVQIMAWSRPGDKPLSEPMMVCLLTHICVTRPQWVKSLCSHMTHIPYLYILGLFHKPFMST